MVRELTGLLDINGVVASLHGGHLNGHLDDRPIREVLEDEGFEGLKVRGLKYRNSNGAHSSELASYILPESEE